MKNNAVWFVGGMVMMLLVGAAATTRTAAAAARWEYAKLHFDGGGGYWQVERGHTRWEKIEDRQVFVKAFTGRDTDGSRVAVLGAVSVDGWEIVANSDIGNDGEAFYLRRAAR